MKIFKRTASLFLAFCLCAGMLLLQPQSTVSAATTTTPTTKVLRIYSRSQSNSDIHINLPKGKVCYVKNIKTNSKNLIAKNTRYYTSTSTDEYTNPYAEIGLYAKKEGTYKVTYNICDKAGKKLSSGKVTVYAKNDSPVKSAKFANKEINSALTKHINNKDVLYQMTVDVWLWRDVKDEIGDIVDSNTEPTAEKITTLTTTKED